MIYRKKIKEIYEIGRDLEAYKKIQNRLYYILRDKITPEDFKSDKDVVIPCYLFKEMLDLFIDKSLWSENYDNR